MQENYRIISYDTETTQEILLEKGQLKHNVNFLGAHVFCLRCISNGTWRNKLKPQDCIVCGDNRYLSWAPFELEEEANEVDAHFITDNPARGFLDWILKETNHKFTSHCFAHNAGRFGSPCHNSPQTDNSLDLMLLYEEIIKMDLKVVPELIRSGNRLYLMKIQERGRKKDITPTEFKDS
jgi:hypothetical protein